ncbi:MAG: hypothetical protein K9K79_04240 [Desulfohalobiaceae bacterium]|nr:hypothetical protein [Desulfohalobiaceae bacterium]
MINKETLRHLLRHSGEGRNPVKALQDVDKEPAVYILVNKRNGTLLGRTYIKAPPDWIPAFAGMTDKKMRHLKH